MKIIVKGSANVSLRAPERCAAMINAGRISKIIPDLMCNETFLKELEKGE